MASKTNYERVGQSLEILRDGIKPFLMRELEAAYGDRWRDEATSRHNYPKGAAKTLVAGKGGDIKIVLELMWDFWNDVFRKTLGHAERSLVSELRDSRHRWAHQETFGTDDAYRVMDSTERLLSAISAPEAHKVAGEKQRLMRERYEQQIRDERKKGRQLLLEGQPTTNLKPWREIVTPHRDVASGNYQKAEFAADLSQIFRGEGSPEYTDAREFFRRTYVTEGLQLLLKNALDRIYGDHGDPVMELQTNFGGGKTHSMLALYHLFSGEKPAELPGVEGIAKELGVTTINAIPRAVLVGTALSPAQPRRKDDGTEIRTLWGELGWQLLGKDGYSLVADADQTGVSPGSDVLREIFKRTGGCLVLIDEWVAYVRLLYGKNELSGGTFESNITFAQSLTEAARAVPHTLLVASIPASKIEIGGDGGEIALEQLKHTFGRLESPWRPASAEESFEIVRRRLFEEISDSRLFANRDGVIDSFCNVYRGQTQEFPTECREADYKRRMQRCYPIHPELFDRLYNEWSSLDKFQRTRGILRLMASVIHTLWENNDNSLLILPCSVPINDPLVQPELVRYLEDTWVPVIERDIDGPNSIPLRLDRENPNMGRYSACRRVARAIYMASAPTLHTANRGTDDSRIKLGCVQPGESIATFGDALRRLTDHAMHLYVDKNRYWYSTQPSVLSLAKDRAIQCKEEDVYDEIVKLLRTEENRDSRFQRVHVCPGASSDVADDYDTGLVVLSPESTYQRNEEASTALTKAKEILAERGNTPRQFHNSLVFLSSDKKQLESLDEAVRQYLSWKSIDEDKGADALNLDAFQARQAKTRRDQAFDTVKQRIPEAYQWILVPYQQDPRSDQVSWNSYKPLGTGSLAERVIARLEREEALVSKFAGTRLRIELDRVPLWRENHVEIRQLAEDFAKYVYLPRLLTSSVLFHAIEDGVSNVMWQHETFSYADSFDQSANRYVGLKAGQHIMATSGTSGLLVKSEIAACQLEKERPTEPGETGQRSEADAATGSIPEETSEISESLPTRFFGSCEIDPLRVTRDTGKISDEVVQYISSLKATKVKLTLEIEADIPEGTPENIVQTITENCNSLNFKDHGFET